MTDKKRATCLVVLAAAPGGSSGSLWRHGPAEARTEAPLQPRAVLLSDGSKTQGDEASTTGAGNAPGEPAAERMIIWNAAISLTVKDAQQALDQAQGMARRLGGYTVSSESWLTDDQLNARLTIRVPAERFEDAMASCEHWDSSKPRECDQPTTSQMSTSTSNPVSVPSKPRRRNCSSSWRTPRIPRRCCRVRAALGDADRDRAGQRPVAYLEKLSAMATITAELYPEQAELPVVEEGWKPLSTLKNAAGVGVYPQRAGERTHLVCRVHRAGAAAPGVAHRPCLVARPPVPRRSKKG